MKSKSVVGLLVVALLLITSTTAFAATTPSYEADTGKTKLTVSWSPTDAQPDGIFKVEGKDNITTGVNGPIIEGTVQPIIMKAVVPTKVSFDIDPNKTWNKDINPVAKGNGTDAFTSPAFVFENACNAPLTFSVMKIGTTGTRTPTTVASTAPTVVKEGTYTDDQWKALSNSLTNANIAFGFKAIQETGASVGWQRFYESDGTTAKATTAINNADATDVWYDPGADPDSGKGVTIGDIKGNTTAKLALKSKYGMSWGNTVEDKLTYFVTYAMKLAA